MVKFNKLVEFYAPAIDKHLAFTELKMWRNKLATKNIMLNTAFDGLLKCNEEIYPNIYFLFKILCTLPVSTSCPERTFSSLKRIKTYLRNTMSEVSNILKYITMHFLKLYYFQFRIG